MRAASPVSRFIPTALFALSLAVPFTARAQTFTQAHLWSRGYGGTSSDDFRAVAFDASGNVFVFGQFAGTANFGGADLTSAGGTDLILAKYDAQGTHVWSKRIGGTLDDVGLGVTVDASGNAIITGYMQGSVDFGGGALNSAGSTDVYIAKYNSAGAHQWSDIHGSTGADRGYGVDTDASGNVYAAGYFSLTVNFGGSSLISAGSSDVYVAKYNSAGTHQWSARYGSTGSDEAHAIALDSAGSLFVTGHFQNTVNFGGANLASAGAVDVFLAKYTTAAGVHEWSMRGGGTGTDQAWGLAVDAGDKPIITGSFGGTAGFGGANLEGVSSYDVFVAKYTPTGTHFFSAGFGSTGVDVGNAVATDADGNIIVVGYEEAGIDFGGGALADDVGPDAFVARFEPGLVHVWSRSFAASPNEIAHGVAVAPTGNFVTVGTFGGGANFGGGAIAALGGIDAFAVMYSFDPQEPVILSMPDIPNDQGRAMKLVFHRSGHDQLGAESPIISYEAYRRTDAPPATAAAGEASAPRARGVLDQGWTQVGAVSAHGHPEYSIDVPTIGDSTVALGMYRSTFFIRAATDNPFVYYDSYPDSAWSVDNLSPGVPQNLAYAAGDLTWDESAAPDFDYFTVYGSNTDLFGAGMVVVDYSVSPAMDVTASPYVFYFVTATDFSGNEGKPARVNTLSDIGGTPKSYVLSVSNYPNPFNPRTTVSYTVPSRGAVSISIYDTRGALVATLFNGDRSAGAYTIGWDGRGQSGTPVSTGVYFARIEHGGATRTKKMVLLK